MVVGKVKRGVLGRCCKGEEGRGEAIETREGLGSWDTARGDRSRTREGLGSWDTVRGDRSRTCF